jgi:hypothetical protein
MTLVHQTVAGRWWRFSIITLGRKINGVLVFETIDPSIVLQKTKKMKRLRND